MANARRKIRVRKLILTVHGELSRFSNSVCYLKFEKTSEIVKINVLAWEKLFNKLYDEEKGKYRIDVFGRKLDDADLLFYIAYKIKILQDNIKDLSQYPPLEIAKDKSIKLFLDFGLFEYADLLCFGWEEYYKKYVLRKEDESE